MCVFFSKTWSERSAPKENRICRARYRKVSKVKALGGLCVLIVRVLYLDNIMDVSSEENI